jgi:hypothetical protein
VPGQCQRRVQTLGLLLLPQTVLSVATSDYGIFEPIPAATVRVDGRGQVLVLSGPPHDAFARPTSLRECQTLCSQSGGVGGQEPWRFPGATSQPQMGAAARQVLGAIGGWGWMADGPDEDGAHAARMDEWVARETVEMAAPRGEG